MVWHLDDGAVTLAAFIFFFQAEDGIRDLTVTGVQTCALPISLRMAAVRPLGLEERLVPRLGHVPAARPVAGLAPHPAEVPGRRGVRKAGLGPRSEERRVGKECRSRWSPARSNKK